MAKGCFSLFWFVSGMVEEGLCRQGWEERVFQVCCCCCLGFAHLFLNTYASVTTQMAEPFTEDAVVQTAEHF